MILTVKSMYGIRSQNDGAVNMTKSTFITFIILIAIAGTAGCLHTESPRRSFPDICNCMLRAPSGEGALDIHLVQSSDDEIDNQNLSELISESLQRFAPGRIDGIGALCYTCRTDSASPTFSPCSAPCETVAIEQSISPEKLTINRISLAGCCSMVLEADDFVWNPVTNVITIPQAGNMLYEVNISGMSSFRVEATSQESTRIRANLSPDRVLLSEY